MTNSGAPPPMARVPIRIVADVVPVTSVRLVLVPVVILAVVRPPQRVDGARHPLRPPARRWRSGRGATDPDGATGRPADRVRPQPRARPHASVPTPAALGTPTASPARTKRRTVVAWPATTGTATTGVPSAHAS